LDPVFVRAPEMLAIANFWPGTARERHGPRNYYNERRTFEVRQANRSHAQVDVFAAGGLPFNSCKMNIV
jgi:hypothetical protein